MHFLVRLSVVMHCPLKNRTANVVKVVRPDARENLCQVVRPGLQIDNRLMAQEYQALKGR